MTGGSGAGLLLGSRRAVLGLCLGAATLGVLAGFAVWPGDPEATAGHEGAAAPIGLRGRSVSEAEPAQGTSNDAARAGFDDARAGFDDAWAGFKVVPERPAPNFELTDASGEAWSLAGQRGTVTLLVFGYTRCPDVCPQTLAKLEKAFARLGDASGGVQVALVTTDPEFDTPEVLSAYVDGFDLPLVGLTGVPENVRSAGALYAAQPQIAQTSTDDGHADAADPSHADGGHADAADPSHADDGHADAADPSHSDDGHADAADLSHADHSSRVWLIDASGQLRVTFMGPFTIDDVVRDVTRLLAERR